MRDIIEDTLKDSITKVQISKDRLTLISVKKPMQKTFIKPILAMVLKSYAFQEANLKIILTRYLQHKEKVGV